MINYLHCFFGFDGWNPVQEKCVPHFTRDVNLVVGAGMASGKTAIAEAVMGYELARGKCVYVSPLRSIGAERISKWRSHPTFGVHRPVLRDGTHPADDREIGEAGVLVTTPESMDMMCRRNAPWIPGVSVLAVDEAHVIGEPGRGPAVESMLMRFCRLNRSARLVLLSGTMPNVRELAGWVKSLNGKPTAFVASGWRPHRTDAEIVPVDGFGGCLDAAVRDVLANRGRKTLVFVHSRRMGEEIRRALRKRGVRCAFFCSGMDDAARDAALGDFAMDGHSLDVIVSTSSLAMGVNV